MWSILYPLLLKTKFWAEILHFEKKNEKNLNFLGIVCEGQTTKKGTGKKTSSLRTFYWTSEAKLTVQQQQRPHCRNVQTD